MEKTKEEYLTLLGKRIIKTIDLPKELLGDEQFIKQVYTIDESIVYYANTEISVNIFKEVIKKNPFIINLFPKKVLLICEGECVESLRRPVPYKSEIVKACPKEILLNNPQLCEDLLKEGIPLENFPEEVVANYKEKYTEVLNESSVDESKSKLKRETILGKTSISQNATSYPREVLINNPELASNLLQDGVGLEHIPAECQIRFPDLCIEYLKVGDYERNFKSLADEIKIKYVDLCVAALKRLNKVERNGQIQKNTDIYRYIPNKLYSNLNFVKSVSAFDNEIFNYIPKEKYTDIEFVQELLKINKVAAKYVDSEILKKLLNQDSVKVGAEWQEECLEEIKDKQYVILSSPTGSGKTRVFLEWAKQKQERPIYITSPIKALSNQRWRELKKQGFIVGLETGDIKYVPRNCDFICCTQEIYTNKYAEQENATLIVDEFHYIFENPKRTRAYIDGLHYSKAKNILLCSATFGDIDKLVTYMDKVSSRNFYAYQNHNRLTKLNFEGHIDKEKIKNALVIAFNPKSIKIICNDIILNRTEKDEEEISRIRAIAQKYELNEEDLLKYVKFGVAYYYGKMLPKEKLFIEELFENKLIDTVVGTDALALGVNFPIENVVFSQLAKDTSGPISKNLFDQLAGRAGRKGYFDEGFVYYCDDFKNSQGNSLEGKKYDTSELYYKILFAENENMSISLGTRIKEILLGETTIEKEAEYIFKYSSESQASLEKIKEMIKSKIEYIQNYDLAEEVIEEEFDLQSYANTILKLKGELQEKVIDRKREVMPLQEEFENNIAEVYFNEVDLKHNCRLFKDILLGTDLDILVEKHCSSFQDLLQLRKYMYALPRKYRQYVEISQLETMINSRDSTTLNLGRGALSISEIARGVREEQLETERIRDVFNKMTSQQGSNEQKLQYYINDDVAK